MATNLDIQAMPKKQRLTLMVAAALMMRAMKSSSESTGEE